MDYVYYCMYVNKSTEVMARFIEISSHPTEIHCVHCVLFTGTGCTAGEDGEGDERYPLHHVQQEGHPAT